jgi:hypothetical protein
MAAFIRASIDTANSVLNTDEWNAYNNVNSMVIHRRVNHSEAYSINDMFSGQYGAICTNTIEGFWAIVKRAIYGQFHHVSKKYLGLYIGEIVFRFNNRKNENAFHEMLSIAVKP